MGTGGWRRARAGGQLRNPYGHEKTGWTGQGFAGYSSVEETRSLPMTKKELRKLCTTPDWRWGTFEGAELHTLLLGLQSTFREKLEWLEEAETFTLQLRASREQAKKRKTAGQNSTAPTAS